MVNGLKADYVNFSLEGDVTRLVKAGLVDESWKSGPTKGIVSDSAVVIVVQGKSLASRIGRTWSSRVSRSSRPTRRRPVRRVGTSWRPISR